jgi:hypothetical protein
MIQTRPKIMKPNMTGLNQTGLGSSSVFSVGNFGARGFETLAGFLRDDDSGMR